uniref:Uncharacterized protein n=1 Tax=Biomphalaria glabrata TaxID=6526 RepID=A0A2C9LSG0_BIOGL
MVAELENDKQELMAFLEEEKRKVEDLQFQLEEEALKEEGDAKAPGPTQELLIKELERQLKKEQERSERLEKDLLQIKASKTGQRPSTLNLTATTAALQKALKEKEEHIEQLLRERDLERSEVARAAAHVDETLKMNPILDLKIILFQIKRFFYSRVTNDSFLE